MSDHGLQGLRAAVALANADDGTATSRALRSIFEAVAAGDHPAAVATINTLISTVVPRLVNHDHRLHLTYTHESALAPKSADSADSAQSAESAHAAEAAVALALLITDTGFARLRICASPTCQLALIDLTRNASRRFCTPRCANRHHVTTYRQRRATRVG